MDMREALTFHDVLLVPKRSSIASRRGVDTTGRFSRRIKLKVPIVSANMDTVTESRMAVALARAGGLGIIHRFLTLEEEAAQVAKVKRSENIVIESPYTIGPDETVGRARGLMREHGVGGLLVVDVKGRLLGLVTERDVQFRDKSEESLRRVMTTKLVTAPPDVGLEKAREILRDHKVEKLPLIDKDGRLKGLITARDIKNRRLYPDASVDSKGRLLVGAAVGVVSGYLERAAAVLEAGADCLVVDVAHGHADHVIKAVENLRRKFPKAEIVAGNVATYEGARDLAAAGADGVKVGVGPGSICSTRIISGAGVPQLTAVMDCARITKENDVPIIADGGLRDSGDLAKAFAGGASSVMLGSLLAGAEESPGWTVVRGGARWKIYRGMASLGATLTRKNKERREDEALDPIEVSEVVPEGVESMAPYKGPVAEVLFQLIGGVRSGMSYSGAATLPEFWKKAEFTRITSASWAESRPHHLDK
ncbi:MAG TPA: IMP dehydrogenase [Elusimicrobia bacterium]|nr:MAG: IMP dehydrogenase [Elusimicrobia bacterium GWA2_66_18]HAZ08268.1 IMP dehydrogenase [Elusimicrobiota bacterium]